jgi:pimeloyl-ACP methyl ester carboxylesterase
MARAIPRHFYFRSVFRRACIPGNAEGAMKPTILILNGLLQYQTAVGLPSPTTLLVQDLQALGFRVVTDTHLVWAHGDEDPVVVMGHSRGGGAALRFAARMKAEAKFQPLVITFDAVPAYRCPTRCINFQSAEYRLLKVPGAQNLDADLPFLPVVAHSYMPSSPAVRGRVRSIVRSLAGGMP